MKLSVIIPVYNEVETLEELIRRVQKVNLDKEIIIVDDGSTNGSGERIRQQGKDIKTIFHPENLGKGAGVMSGLKVAEGDYVLIQDADLEYDPQDYPKLIKPIEQGKTEVVFGSRFKGKGEMFFWQLAGNKLLTFWIDLLYGVRLSDMHTCYKLLPTELIRKLNLTEKGFGFDTELTAKILRQRVRICEVPISFRYRENREGKKISYLRDGLRSWWLITKLRF